LTPVEHVKVTYPPKKTIHVFLKREDRFVVPGTQQCGSKARVCWLLLHKAKQAGTSGVATAVLARSSPQSARVAAIAQVLGMACHLHAPQGPLWPQLELAQQAGATVFGHFPGYPNVLNKALSQDQEAASWLRLPFGLECPEHLELNKHQVSNLPFGSFKRLVVPVGSGMSLAGILHGLLELGQLGSTPILAVWVGGKPNDDLTQSKAAQLLDRVGPKDWRRFVEIQHSGLQFSQSAARTLLTDDIMLDEGYEAKCIPFLRNGDLLWIIGCREANSRDGVRPRPPRSSKNKPAEHQHVEPLAGKL
jgi:1-aminocyclopropane-1-carboxylate deaminase/D-cysteine desulfhydrase-like pyridoxal-dependent ACC family enzyme